jgi:hypothetical protein
MINTNQRSQYTIRKGTFMRLNKLVNVFLSTGILLTAVILAGCKGAAGPAGPPGTNPPMSPRITAVLAVPDSVGSGQISQLLASAYSPNGDSLTYLWTASTGTLSNTNRATTSWTAPDVAGIAFIKVVVSSATHGNSTDSIAIGVNTRTPTVFPSYLGTDSAACGHCHAATIAQWTTSGHHGTFDSLNTSQQDSLYCQQCHTTGFTDTYDVNGNLVTRGPNNGGYNNNPVAGLRGVQCEQCHGPMGPNQANHVPTMNAALEGSTCGQCHSSYQDWLTSRHGTVIERNGDLSHWSNSATCQPCHISEGFLKLQDPNWATATVNSGNAHEVTCVTCHDPHQKTATGNKSQLRGTGPATLPFDMTAMASYSVTGLGKGQLCAQCHKSRRDATAIQTQITSGTNRPGPHDSPQTDMYVGHGNWEVAGGSTITRESQHAFLTNACVDCHMKTRDGADRAHQDPVHEMSPQLSTCVVCHPGATDFNINGVQTEIQQLLDSLASYLPPMDSTNTSAWTPEKRAAAWSWYFVKNDKSLGVHNRDYARTSLLNAIDYVRAHP